MSFVFLSLATAVLWVNLVGTGLAAHRWVRDYPVARVAGVLGVCLVSFFTEHLVGFGPRPPLLVLTTAASVFLIYRHRMLLRGNLWVEALFGAGYFYCLAWRYAFPDIDSTGEKMPNLMMITAYMKGSRLPAPDLWLAPFRLNCYYSFQHYCAGLMGRILGAGTGPTYQLAYCVMAGFITLLCGACFVRLCPWRTGRVIGTAALLIGGSGAAVAAHVMIRTPALIDGVRFIGGSVVHDPLTSVGERLAALMGAWASTPHDLPMEPLGYVLLNGDFHPPLAGYVLLGLACAVIAAQAAGSRGAERAAGHSILAASIPLAMISNAWVFPLQFVLVTAWFLLLALRRDRGFVVPALAGVAAGCILEFPFLVQFTQQAIGANAAISVTAPGDRTPVVAWWLTFWPVAALLGLALLDRARRPLAFWLVVVWGSMLVGTEFFYNHDVYGGAWSRFNTTLKWWPWVYAGILMTAGPFNLGSASRLCRYGTALVLLPTLIFAYDAARGFYVRPKLSAGKLSGSGWLESDIAVRDLIVGLSAKPDGVTVESGAEMANNDTGAVALFAGKPLLLGWPWHETTWRGAFLEIDRRRVEIADFYAGKLADPLGWLLQGDVTYVLWLARDNVSGNRLFGPLSEKIRPRYTWHPIYGDSRTLAIGYWQRVERTLSPGR